MTRRRATLGYIREHAGHFQAVYIRNGQRHTPGHTFRSFALADQWLAAEQLLIERDQWTPPASRRAQDDPDADAVTFAEFATEVIDRRAPDLSANTARDYRAYRDGRLAEFGPRPLNRITREDVDAWWAANADAPTLRKRCYEFLGSVFREAVSRDLVAKSPCQVRLGNRRVPAANKDQAQAVVLRMTPQTIATLAAHMDPPWRAWINVLAYAGLRPNEALALRRDDFTTDQDERGVPRWVMRVSKSVTKAEDGQDRLGETKTRSVAFLPIAPHLAELLDAHLDQFAGPGKQGLVFPARPGTNDIARLDRVKGTRGRNDKRMLKPSPPTKFYAAAAAAGEPDLNLYWLRKWARKTWRAAGLDFEAVEHLLTHKLGPVAEAYATVDHAALWPGLDKVSQAAGWQPPSSELPVAPANSVVAAMADTMTTEQLRTMLAGLDQVTAGSVIASLPPHRWAELLASPGPSD